MSNAKLQALEARLSSSQTPFLGGAHPGAEDAAEFEAVAKLGEKSLAAFPRVNSWWSTVSQFTPARRGAWAGSGSGASKGGHKKAAPASPAKPAAEPAKPAPAPAPAPTKAAKEEEEDDLFASDDEADRAHEEMLKAKVAAARAGKPEKEKPRQRSLIQFEIKPSEVETDLEKMAAEIKRMELKGVQNWGNQHKLQPVAYGINKLLMNVVVWDDDVIFEDIEQALLDKFPEDIQSIDIAAMSKV